jgi:prefoldin subunit 5
MEERINNEIKDKINYLKKRIEAINKEIEELEMIT